jgi:hypothetical protein
VLSNLVSVVVVVVTVPESVDLVSVLVVSFLQEVRARAENTATPKIVFFIFS